MFYLLRFLKNVQGDYFANAYEWPFLCSCSSFQVELQVEISVPFRYVSITQVHKVYIAVSIKLQYLQKNTKGN